MNSFLNKNRWITLYFFILFLFIILGKVFTETLPIVQFNLPADDVFIYEKVAPGWASRQPFRSYLEPWARWDTINYLNIAVYGYRLDDSLVAFPPVYPFLIRSLGKLLGGQFLLASLLISWISFYGVCFLLNERIQQSDQDQNTVRIIRNMVFFPTAIFFFAGYTESLFLLLTLLAWRYADEGKWLLVDLIGAAAVLTRFTGLFLLLPFGYIWWRNRPPKRVLASIYAFIPIPFAYFWWIDYTASIFHIAPTEALTKGWALHFDWPWVGIIGSLQKIMTEPISKTFYAYVDIFAVFAALWAIIWWLNRKGYPEALFTAGILLISLMKISDMGILGSTSRYILPLFPIYFVQVSYKHPVLHRLSLLFSITFWLTSAAMFFTWNWLA